MLAPLVAGLRLGPLLHAARLDRGAALQALQPGDLIAPCRHDALQLRYRTQQVYERPPTRHASDWSDRWAGTSLNESYPLASGRAQISAPARGFAPVTEMRANPADPNSGHPGQPSSDGHAVLRREHGRQRRMIRRAVALNLEEVPYRVAWARRGVGCTCGQRTGRARFSSPVPVSAATAVRGPASCRKAAANRCWRPPPHRCRRGNRRRCRAAR